MQRFLEGLGSLDASDLQPAVDRRLRSCSARRSVRRTVTNVCSRARDLPASVVVNRRAARVTVHPEQPDGSVRASRRALKSGIANAGAPAGEWRFGDSLWADGVGPNADHAVSIPIAVKAQSLFGAVVESRARAPHGDSPSTCSFGYNRYVHGRVRMGSSSRSSREFAVENDPNHIVSTSARKRTSRSST